MIVGEPRHLRGSNPDRRSTRATTLRVAEPNNPGNLMACTSTPYLVIDVEGRVQYILTSSSFITLFRLLHYEFNRCPRRNTPYTTALLHTTSNQEPCATSLTKESLYSTYQTMKGKIFRYLIQTTMPCYLLIGCPVLSSCLVLWPVSPFTLRQSIILNIIDPLMHSVMPCPSHWVEYQTAA